MSKNQDNANHADELLSAYLDGELTADERAAVEARLEADPTARQALDELRALSATLRGLPPAAPDRALGEAINQRLNEQFDARREDDAQAFTLPIGRSPRSWVWAGLAVAAALVVMALSPDQPDGDDVALLADGAVEKETAAGAVAPEARDLGIAALDEADSISQPARELARELEAPTAPAPASEPMAVAPRGGRSGGGFGTGGAADSFGFRDSRAADADLARRPTAAPASDSASGERFALSESEFPLLLVQVGLRPHAYQANFVDEVFVDNGIAVEPLGRASGVNAEQPGARAPAADRDAIVANARRALPDNRRRGAAPEPGVAVDALGDNDLLMVVAPAAQFAAALDTLNMDYVNCGSIYVAPPAEPPAPKKRMKGKINPADVASQWMGYNRSGGYAQQAQRARAQTRAFGGKAAPAARAYRLQDQQLKQQAALVSPRNNTYFAPLKSDRGRALLTNQLAQNRSNPLPAPTDASAPVQALVIVEPEPTELAADDAEAASEAGPVDAEGPAEASPADEP